MSVTTCIQESTRYDRQIRVWGAEAQYRLQNARVLVINFTNLNVELTKNLVLAGVHVTIADNREVSVHDLTNNYFVSVDDLGCSMTKAVVNRVQDLNSFVTVQTLDVPIQSLDETTLHEFDVILLSGGSEIDALRISQACRSRPQGGGSFFWSDASGDEGIFFSDYGREFQYAPDPQQNTNNPGDSNANKSKAELQTVFFPSLEEVLAVSWASIPSRLMPLSKTFVKSRIVHKYRNIDNREVDQTTTMDTLEEIFGSLLTENGLSKENCVTEHANLDWNNELHRICINQQVGSVLTVSMLGSFLSQEVIKVISRTGKPGSNIFTYDGDSLVVRSFPVALKI